MNYPPGFIEFFISPVTGKLGKVGQLPFLGSPDYIIIGDDQGNPVTSPALIDVKLDIVELRTILDKLRALKFIIQEATTLLPDAQALKDLVNGFVFNNNGVLTIEVPGSGSISLPEGYVFVGDEDDLAAAQPTINFSNLPDLTNRKIWRGNVSNRPVESDDLTNTENSLSTTIENLANLASIVSALSDTVNALSSAVDAIETGIASIGGFAAILLLQVQVLGLIGAVASLASRMSTAESDIDTLQGQVATINSQISTINGQITDIYSQLATIFSDIADINERIDNLAATFIGDVQGSGLLSAPISLELMLTLDQIKKAQATVDLNNNKIINLVSDDVEQLDALNAKFLWDLMHDNVGVVWV